MTESLTGGPECEAADCTRIAGHLGRHYNAARGTWDDSVSRAADACRTSTQWRDGTGRRVLVDSTPGGLLDHMTGGPERRLAQAQLTADSIELALGVVSLLDDPSDVTAEERLGLRKRAARLLAALREAGA